MDKLKGILVTSLLLLTLSIGVSAQSKKVTELTSDTAPTIDDLTMTVNDPSGTPANRKVTLANLFFAMAPWNYCSDAGANDTYACSLSPAPSSYVTGNHFRFKANTANTGAATINFNSLGAKTIKKAQGGITTDLSDNDIRAGQWVDLVYDGTNMQMQSTLGNAASSGTVTTTGSPASGQIAAFSSASAITSATATDTSSPAICADAGSNDTYACSLSPAIASYVTGTHYRFKANTINTGAASINFNALGAKTIKKLNDQDLGDGDVEAGQWVDLVYDGTNMQMQSQIANSAGGGGTTINSTDTVIPYRSNATTFADSPLFREDANTVAQRNSTNAQTLNLYQTFTDASNYSRLTLKNNGSGAFELNTAAAGSGTLQRLEVKIGSTSGFVFQNSVFSPITNNGHSLGDGSHFWNGVYGSGFINGAGNGYQWSGRAGIYSESSSIIRITDAGGGDSAITLRFGGTASNSPALRRSSANLEAVVADASAYTAMVALKHCYSGTTVCDFAGSGSPESAVTASVGSTYRRTDGGAGTSFYVKESGSGNTGWVAK